MFSIIIWQYNKVIKEVSFNEDEIDDFLTVVTVFANHNLKDGRKVEIIKI